MGYDFDFSALWRAWPYLLDGLKITFLLVIVSMAAGIVLGTLLAIGRMFGPKPVAVLAAGYVNLFRSIPLILTLFWFYVMMPGIVRLVSGDPYASVGPIYAALAALILAESAYYCEIIRAGIGSVRAGQMQASLSLGMGRWQALRYVVLPQAFQNMTPSLLNQTIALLKDTSLVYVISMNDFLGAATRIGHRDGSVVEIYVFVAVIYFVFCSSGTWLADRLQLRRRNSRPIR